MRRRARRDEATPVPVDAATQYARAVVAGEVPAGQLVTLACQRHLVWLESLPPLGYVWDVEEIELFREFCRCLRHQKGRWRGMPIELEPWQVFVCGSILGWKRPDGSRVFRKAYIAVPRKNGKTLMAAILLFYLTFFSGEPAAEGYCLATKLDQAKLAYNVIKSEVESNVWLRRRKGHGTLDSFGGDGPRAIPKMVDLQSGCELSALDAEQKTKDGFNPAFALADEYHEHPSDGLVQKVETGMEAREQPLLVFITTAGATTNSPCYREHETAEKVLRGTVDDDEYFAFPAQRNPDVDWWSELAVRQANPSIGVTVELGRLLRKLERARTTPRLENWYRRMYLNDWVSQVTRWLPMHLWDRCLPQELPLVGRRCFGAIDLSKSRDLTAFNLLFPHTDGSYSLLTWTWVTEEAAERRKGSVQPYDVWIAQGLISMCEGNTIDYAAVERCVVDASERYDLRLVGYDPGWGGSVLAQRLELQGIHTSAIRQRAEHMAEPTGLFEDLVRSGKLRHAGNPVLRWQAEHAAVRTDAQGNRMVVKPRGQQGQGEHADDEAKVDNIVCAVMALKCAALTEEGQRDEDDGPVVITGARG